MEFVQTLLSQTVDREWISFVLHASPTESQQISFQKNGFSCRDICRN